MANTFTSEVSIAQTLSHLGDTDTKIDFGTDTIDLSVGGIATIALLAGRVAFNTGLVDIDFKVSSDTQEFAFHVDGSTSELFVALDLRLNAGDLTVTAGDLVVTAGHAAIGTGIGAGSSLLIQDDVTTSTAATFRKNVTTTAADIAVVSILQDHTGGIAPCLRLKQDDIDDVFINFVGTSAADSTRSISSSTAEAAAKFGAFQVEINGTAKWVRVYDSAV